MVVLLYIVQHQIITFLMMELVVVVVDFTEKDLQALQLGVQVQMG
jgi:hypothetical protein